MTDRRIIETTLPLSPQHQIEFFKDKNILFNIDISSSKLTPKQCLAILSNMKLEAEIKDITPELMKEYMLSNSVVKTTNLAKVYANIITGYKFGLMFYPEVETYFTMDQYAQFIVDNQTMIEQHCSILRSIPLFLLVNSTSFLEDSSVDQIFNFIDVVDKKVDEVGMNLCQLVSLPNFLTNFYTADDLQHSLVSPYYKYYFDEYVYGGDRLIKFLASDKHQSDFAIQALATMKCLKEGQFAVEKIEEQDDNGRPVQEDEHSG